MSRDVTTNLRFPERIYRDLQYAAGRRGVSMAAIVREAVAVYLGRADEAVAIPIGDDPADRLIGSVSADVTDESVHHDRYLYGWTSEGASEAAGRHGRAPRPRDAKGSAPSSRGRLSQTRTARPIRDDGSRAGRGGHASERARRGRQSRRSRS